VSRQAGACALREYGGIGRAAPDPAGGLSGARKGRKMARTRTALLLAAACSGLVAAAHVGIAFGGARWYRFFGAPSLAARMERGEAVLPTLLTLALALVFTAWALYALSGAGVLRRLARARTVLLGIGAIYALRGLLLLVDLVVVLRGGSVPARAFAFSAFSLLTGALYLVGAAHRPATRPAPQRRRRARRG